MLRRMLKFQETFTHSWYRHKTDRSTPKPVLYGDEVSPPVRFVMMAATLLRADLDFYMIDLFLSENKTEFYKKINPLLKVPALALEDVVIRDSHAIALYLCRTSPGQALYPAEPQRRAAVDQIMFFNSGSMFPLDSRIFTEYFAGQQNVKKEDMEKCYHLLDYLEYQLADQPWLAGNEITLADLCCSTTVSSLQLLIPIGKRHNKVLHWMEKLKNLPCYQINTQGLKRLREQLNKYKH